MYVQMATLKRLDFSDTRLHKSPSSEEVSTKKKNKKKKLASPVIKRIWNEDDELSILKVHHIISTPFTVLDPLFSLTRSGCGILGISRLQSEDEERSKFRLGWFLPFRGRFHPCEILQGAAF